MKLITMQKSGYRVLLLAHIDGTIENEELPSGDIEVVSLILIEDNVRPDAIKTIDYFKKSGVDVKVISGDNPITVSKISERAGINRANEYISLDGMEDEDVIRAASKYTVFGRVSPAQKRLLVHTLKEEGKIVAMTGDGVNDILALREADCSIAVASGSEAARNVSHLVLMDSNFDSMPKVVSEGRRVINNVANVASLFLTKTIFSFLLAIQALQSGGIYPISTLQLLIIDVFLYSSSFILFSI
ncbi:MAG: HAD-IC family P-type ATPase [Clostridium sp.]|nr:MAG: HAD-IC family P-type ATPase [Clostridium sp.]